MKRRSTLKRLRTKAVQFAGPVLLVLVLLALLFAVSYGIEGVGESLRGR